MESEHVPLAAEPSPDSENLDENDVSSSPIPQFDARSGRFVVVRPILSTHPRLPGGWQRELNGMFEETRKNPVLGLSRVLELRVAEADRDVGVFEILPGHSLDDLIDLHKGIPPTAWVSICLQLLDIAEEASDRGYLELDFDPSTIHAWLTPDHELRMGFGNYGFSMIYEAPEDRWQRWFEELSLIFTYLAVGEWPGSYETLLEFRNGVCSRVKQVDSLRAFFKALLNRRSTERPVDPDAIRRLFAACSKELGSGLPESFIEPMMHLPQAEQQTPWMIHDEQLPAQLKPQMGDWDPAHPNLVPVLDAQTNQLTIAHVLPPKGITPQSEQSQIDRAWEICAKLNDLAVPPLLDRWEVHGCQVMTEGRVEGIPLTDIIEKRHFLQPLEVLQLGMQVHLEMLRIEKLGLQIPSLNPHEVHVVPNEGVELDSSYSEALGDRTKYRVQLRVLPANYLHGTNAAYYKNDAIRSLLYSHLRDLSENQFVELMARLLGVHKLASPTIMSVFQENCVLERSERAEARGNIINQLSAILEPRQRELRCPTVQAKTRHRRRMAMASGSIAAALALVGLVLFGLKRGDASFSDIYAEVKAALPSGQAVEPPENLTPVTGDASIPKKLTSMLGVGNEIKSSGKASASFYSSNYIQRPLSAKEKAEGWEYLFDGESLCGFEPDPWQQPNDLKNWRLVEGSIIHCRGMHGRSDLVTEEHYRNFDLHFEFKSPRFGVGGVFYRVNLDSDWLTHGALEFEFADSSRDEYLTRNSAGALLGMIPAQANSVLPAGRWNKGRVFVDGNHIEHWLNGELVMEANIGDEEWQKRYSRSKFRNYPTFGAAYTGPIGFQDHGHDVWIRNIKVKRLPD